MEKQELQALRLWNPLSPKIYRKNEWGDTENEPEDMDANEIVEYQKEILSAIEREKFPNEGERGLAVYLDNDVLKGKVYSINPTVEKWDGKLWGVTEVQSHGALIGNGCKTTIYGGRLYRNRFCLLHQGKGCTLKL